jgi:hypothetical protein
MLSVHALQATVDACLAEQEVYRRRLADAMEVALVRGYDASPDAFRSQFEALVEDGVEGCVGRMSVGGGGWRGWVGCVCGVGGGWGGVEGWGWGLRRPHGEKARCLSHGAPPCSYFAAPLPTSASSSLTACGSRG